MEFQSNFGNLTLNLSEVGIEDSVMDAGGLGQELKVFRLPSEAIGNSLSFSRRLHVKETGDTPIWISAKTEDGFQAWSTPIYLHR